MAHAHDLGYDRHWQALGVGRPDGCVALLSEGFGGSFQGGFAPGVVLGKGHETDSGLRCLAFGTSYVEIV